MDLQNAHHLWKGVEVNEYKAPPMQLPGQPVISHRLVINIGPSLTVHWRTENEVWQSSIYQKGHIAIVPNGGYNETAWDSSLHAIIIALNPDFAQQLLERDITPREVRGLADPSLFRLALEFKDELQHGHEAAQIKGDALAIATAVHVMTRYPNSCHPLYAPKGKLSSGQLIRVVEYCNAFIDQPIRLQQLSQQAHLSPYHFIRQFRNTVGLSPYQYLLNLRIEKARQLIKQHKYSMTEVAYRLGYSDLAHFSNAFKRITGCTPQKYAS